MEALKESILKSVKAGKYALIEEWCKSHDIFKGDFKINSENKIECTNPSCKYLEIVLADDEIVPDYIKFANNDSLTCKVYGTKYYYNGKTLDLHFLPEICYWTVIKMQVNLLTNLYTRTHELLIEGTADKMSNIVFDNSYFRPSFVYGKLCLKEFYKHKSIASTKMVISQVDSMDITHAKIMAKELEKQLKPLPHKKIFTPKYAKILSEFLGKDVDTDRLRYIKVNASLLLAKNDNGEWYKV